MAAPFRFDREWNFAVAPSALWATLTDTGAYRTWWPWIAALDLDDPAFAVGSQARFVIQAPLPYRLHCNTTVVDVEPGVLLVAAVTGDLVGHAALALTPHGAGSVAHLSWSLAVQTAPLRAMARIARPAMVWGHDRIVERGLREFAQHALDGQVNPRGQPASPGDPSSAAPPVPDAPRTSRPAPGPAPPPG